MKTRILTNAYLHTLNPVSPTAEAVAIRDGHILAIGPTEAILSKFKSNVQIEDMGQMHILPGFTDAHIHLLDYGMSLNRVHCETNSRSACIRAVQKKVQEMSPGQWLRGHGWNQNVWPEGMGSKTDLDAVSPNNPVYLTHKSLHSAWVNSRALIAAGITKDTPNPENGDIERDSGGNPTGILYENAMKLVENAISKPSRKETIQALERAQENLLAWGITSVHDFDTWECYQALHHLEESGKLKLRVLKSIPFSQLEEAILAGLRSSAGSERLRIGWLKLFADGALGPQTAAMQRPYEGLHASGMLFLNAQVITEIGQRAMRAGISTAIHAIGDRANREVLNGYTQLISEGLVDPLPLKPRIEHVQIIEPDDMRRMAEMGITASMQPIHAISDRTTAEKYWGDRCRNAYAWQSVLKYGNRLIFGSDAPVESPNPFWGLYAAITRQPLEHRDEKPAWYPQECLSLRQALEAYIKQPPIASGRAQLLGMLAEGYLADLIVLPKDIFKASAGEIREMQPQRVMSSGEWV